MSDSMTALRELCTPIWNLYSIRSLLNWDQQVLMPPKGSAARAQQLATLEGVSHRLLTSGEFRDALLRAEEKPESDLDRRYLRVVRRDFDLASKLPVKLVEARAKAHALATEAWVDAKTRNDFPHFLPHLREVFRLAREVAECRGYAEHPYDAMIDEYEPGMNTRQVQGLFSAMLPSLVELVRAIADAPNKLSRKCLEQAYPLAGQHEFSRYILERIGFDFASGRLDQSAHPFCSGSTSLDVRLTDRLDLYGVTMSIFGSLHEGGHGLYEQGSPPEWIGTPLAHGCSLGIHESQSRLWENFVGRGLPFWKANFPRLKSIFPQQLSGYSVEQFHQAINYVQPSLIRVEADEVTYTLHIILRFELERDMVNGDIDPADLPAIWNERMKQNLGIEPPDDRRGCLQDIHWSDGLVGYFPTYSLGNLVGAQLWRKVRQEIPDLDTRLENGDCATLLSWLREKIHRHASSVTPNEVIQMACGEDLDAAPFQDYLWEKFGALYGIDRKHVS